MLKWPDQVIDQVIPTSGHLFKRYQNQLNKDKLGFDD